MGVISGLGCPRMRGREEDDDQKFFGGRGELLFPWFPEQI